MQKVMKLTKARQINKHRELGVLLNSTLMQRRILYSCLSVLNPVLPDIGKTKEEIVEWMDQNGKAARELRTYRIDVNDFAKIWGITSAKDMKGKIAEAIGDNTDGSSKIMQLCFKSEVAEKKTLINVISRVELDYETGVMEIVFTDDIMPYLFNLASYTVIPLKATVGFRSNYSFAMIEHLLRTFTNGGYYPTREYPVDELKAILGVSGASYDKWTNFKNRILDAIAVDFAMIDGGGYTLSFEPVYGARRGRGRPQVESVRIAFDNTGVNAFMGAINAKKAGMNYIMGGKPDEMVSPLGSAEAVKEKRASLKRIEMLKQNPNMQLPPDDSMPF